VIGRAVWARADAHTDDAHAGTGGGVEKQVEQLALLGFVTHVSDEVSALEGRGEAEAVYGLIRLGEVDCHIAGGLALYEVEARAYRTGSGDGGSEGDFRQLHGERAAEVEKKSSWVSGRAALESGSRARREAPFRNRPGIYIYIKEPLVPQQLVLQSATVCGSSLIAVDPQSK
jgi:hypothetical protein